MTVSGWHFQNFSASTADLELRVILDGQHYPIDPLDSKFGDGIILVGWAVTEDHDMQKTKPYLDNVIANCKGSLVSQRQLAMKKRHEKIDVSFVESGVRNVHLKDKGESHFLVYAKFKKEDGDWF
jgi:hypothetical protein